MSDMTLDIALHCMKVEAEEEVCEECPAYGKTGTDHCYIDAHRFVINVLESNKRKEQWGSCIERILNDSTGVI